MGPVLRSDEPGGEHDIAFNSIEGPGTEEFESERGMVVSNEVHLEMVTIDGEFEAIGVEGDFLNR